MVILNTVIITFLVIILLIYVLLKFGTPYAKNILQKATEVCCYVNTYHYDKNELERVKIGQDRFYTSLKIKNKSPIGKNKSDFIFWALYTQFYNKLLDTVPIYVARYHNRTLSEGEKRKTAKFLDEYLRQQEKEFDKYATENERARYEASNQCEAEQ